MNASQVITPSTPAPATPTRTRARDNGGGHDVLTPPARANPALRRTVTHEGLPAEFSIGDVNIHATAAHAGPKTGKDLPNGILPPDAIVEFEKIYSGRKANIGAAVMTLVKDQNGGIISMSWKTHPLQIGKEVINVLNSKAIKNTRSRAT